MARNAGIDAQSTIFRSTSTDSARTQSAQDNEQVQAAFDFMPQEMRQRLRFGDVLRAGRAELRNHSWMIDRQVVGLGSRIAAARLREILRPASEGGLALQDQCEQDELGMDVPKTAAGETQILDDQTAVSQRTAKTRLSSAQDLMQQREILREIGTAVFYFRDEDDVPSDAMLPSQRLHPRPLPARYYGAPPQQAGGGASSEDRAASQPTRKIA